MKHYLENHKFYVENKEEKLIYVVKSYETYANCDYLSIDLELVCGWDYINPDESSKRGWVFADRFVEEVQYDTVNQYFLKEGMEEALKWHDYNIVEHISPNLQAMIDKHNEI